MNSTVISEQAGLKLFIKLLFSVIRCHEVSAKNKIRKFRWQVRRRSRVSSLLSATSRSTADLLATVLLEALNVVFHRDLPWEDI